MPNKCALIYCEKKIQLKSIHLIRPTYYLKITWLKSRVLRLAFIMYIKDKNDIKLKLLNNKKGRKILGAPFLVSFSQLPAVKKDIENGALGNFLALLILRRF